MILDALSLIVNYVNPVTAWYTHDPGNIKLVIEALDFYFKSFGVIRGS